MAGNFLEKFIPKVPQGKRGNLPAPGDLPPGGTPSGRLPNASLIYGLAASALFVIALYFLFFGENWFTGILLLVPAGALTGYALHFLRYQ